MSDPFAGGFALAGEIDQDRASKKVAYLRVLLDVLLGMPMEINSLSFMTSDYRTCSNDFVLETECSSEVYSVWEVVGVFSRGDCRGGC